MNKNLGTKGKERHCSNALHTKSRVNTKKGLQVNHGFMSYPYVVNNCRSKALALLYSNLCIT
jgi:hypothetical protein